MRTMGFPTQPALGPPDAPTPLAITRDVSRQVRAHRTEATVRGLLEGVTTTETPPTNGSEHLRAVLRAPVYEAAVVSPLEVMESLSARLGNTVSVKREDRQPIHSFKLRGAYTRMRDLSAEDQSREVVTASAGNHAQGVALSASLLGVYAVVVMPVTTAPIKVHAVRSHGAEVVLFGDTFDAAKAEALRLADERGLTYIAPFDDPLVIAGQGTIGLELIQQDAHLDRVFVPVGGGGLAAGVAVLIKNLMPGIKVIGVEPADAACLTAALAAGAPVELPEVSRFAEGVAVKRIGDLTFDLCRRYLDDVVTVDSDQICAAVKDIFEDVRAVAEPAGAVALAGLRSTPRRTAYRARSSRTSSPAPTSPSTRCATSPSAPASVSIARRSTA